LVDAIETAMVYATAIFLASYFPWPVFVIFLASYFPWPVFVIFLLTYYTVYFVVQGRGAGGGKR
jgi:uncharacterized RDD family membrane protein YckC